MRQKSGTGKSHGEKVVKDIRRATRKQYSAEEKIRIVLDGLKGEDSIAELCRREGIAQSLYYSWSKEFLEAGKKRLVGDTARAATSTEVKDLRRESRDLKEVVAEQALELRLLKKSMIADGDDHPRHLDLLRITMAIASAYGVHGDPSEGAASYPAHGEPVRSGTRRDRHRHSLEQGGLD